MKKILLLFFCLFTIQSTFAEPILGGNISAKYISGYTFEITITIYAKTSSFQTPGLTLDSVYFGDGTPAESFVRVLKTDLANNISRIIFVRNHTYQFAGRYSIYYVDPYNRDDVNNIPHSISIPFAVDMELVIDSLSCPASSPLFNGLPIFIGKKGKDFVENRSYYDPDKDSLSFSLVPCHGSGNLPIPGYSIPAGISLNISTGEFTWQGSLMVDTGEYSFAIKVDKWRNGLNYGYTIEDFPLTLVNAADTNFDFMNTSNYSVDPRGFYVSSVLPTIPFNLTVQYYDSSSNPSMIGLFSEVSSTVSMTLTHPSNAKSNLNISWTPTQNDVRKDPYIFVFRGEPGEKDLTYLVYVNGIDTVTCTSLIRVPEIPFDENNIRIFPNPVHDNLQIEINRNSHDALIYSMIDITGKVLLEKKSFSNSENIRINNLASGVYFLKIENNDAVCCRKIFVF